MLQAALDYRYEVHVSIALLVGLFALVKGGRPEKLLALAYLLIFEGSNLLRDLVWKVNFRVDQVDGWATSVDVVAAVAFILIALNANRNYPLWVAAFQLVSVAGHLARELLEAMTPIAYAVLVIGPSHFITLILAIGLVRHIRRTKRYGEYRDWRTSNRPDALPMSRAEGA